MLFYMNVRFWVICLYPSQSTSMIYASVSMGLETGTIRTVLNKLSKKKQEASQRDYSFHSCFYCQIRQSGANCILLNYHFWRNFGLHSLVFLFLMLGSNVVMWCWKVVSWCFCNMPNKVAFFRINVISVDQSWLFNSSSGQICRFTSDKYERFQGDAGMTENMVAFGDKWSEQSEKIIEERRNQEYGLLLMDEEIMKANLVYFFSPFHSCSELNVLLHLKALSTTCDETKWA